MKPILSLLLGALCASAQVATLPSDVGASKAVIDANFSWLNTNKGGTGACTNNVVTALTSGTPTCASLNLSFFALNSLTSSSGARIAVTGTVPADGCATWTSGILGSTAFACGSGGSGGSGVATFNTRTGAVTLTSTDVTTALTFTPAPQTNTLAILKGNGAGGTAAATSSDLVGLFTGCSGVQYLGADGICHSVGGVSSFNTRGGAVTLGSADVTTALGFTPAPQPNGSSPLKANGSGGFASMSGSDVVGLFSGCSGTNYLGADGACHSSSGSGTVTVSGTPTSNALVTSAGGTVIQTPCSGCVLDSNGNLTVATLSASSSGAAGAIVANRGTGTARVGVQGSTAGEFNILPPANFTSWSLTAPSAPAAAHQWLTTDTGGAGSFSQPAFSDVSGTLALAQMPAASKVRVCELHIWGSGAGQVLQDGDDEPASCLNTSGADLTITGVTCWANAAGPTVTPILTGAGGTSILTGALTCGTAGWGAGTINGSPVLHSATPAGVCSTTPCSIDDNVTSAGGTATNIRIVVTLTM